MGKIHRSFTSVWPLVAALSLGTIAAGCAAGSRYYDDDARDYHRWNRTETTFYLRWEGETHRDHRDFNRRDEHERKEYWEWRHHHRPRD